MSYTKQGTCPKCGNTVFEKGVNKEWFCVGCGEPQQYEPDPDEYYDEEGLDNLENDVN